MNKRLYNIAQWTWGLPQNLAGLVLYAAHRKDRHYNHEGAMVTIWDRKDGISLGKFIFAPDDEKLLSHEYGHTKQSLVLGPFYLIVVGIPSILWNRLPYFKKLRSTKGKAYDSMLIERSATYLGGKGKKRRERIKK